jgi:hypothetical protein
VTIIRSVFIPALVAALVALLIELLAKPHLEVRKERLMRAARRGWELAEAFRAVDVRLETLAWLARQEKATLATIEKGIIDLGREVDEVEQLAPTVELPEPMRAVVDYGIGFFMAVMDELRSKAALAEDERIAGYRSAILSGTDFGLPTVYLQTPRWHVLRRRRLVRDATDLRGRFRDQGTSP